jgi:hypothetical protein
MNPAITPTSFFFRVHFSIILLPLAEIKSLRLVGRENG